MTPEQAIALGTEMVKLLALDPDELGDDVLDSTGRIMVKLARKAVLEGLRRPTKAMIDAHDRAHAAAKTVFAEPADVWRAMIDTAIAEGER